MTCEAPTNLEMLRRFIPLGANRDSSAMLSDIAAQVAKRMDACGARIVARELVPAVAPEDEADARRLVEALAAACTPLEMIAWAGYLRALADAKIAYQ